jgi:hypothetical protein
LDCGGSTPLSFFSFIGLRQLDAAFFLFFIHLESLTVVIPRTSSARAHRTPWQKKESGVKPPQSKESSAHPKIRDGQKKKPGGHPGENVIYRIEGFTTRLPGRM